MINYQLIEDSIKFYSSFGFKRIETPWTVSEGVSDLTKPEGKINYQLNHNGKCLVASGEQSFLYLINKGFLAPGKYQTITPCYRDDEHDVFHTKTFIKNELIITDVVNEIILRKTVDQCQKFFEGFLGPVEVIKTDIGYDIEFKKVEIGSYGIRDFGWVKYIYATGLAEPRFSKVLKLK